MNLVILTFGVAFGGLITFVMRRGILRYRWAGYPHLLVVLDGLVVTVVGIVGAAFELWKPESLRVFDPFNSTAYGCIGCFLAFGIGSKWLLSVAREVSQSTVTSLKQQIAQIEKTCDARKSLEALVSDALEAKLRRVAAYYQTSQGTFEAALDPILQIHILIQGLHGHILKHVTAGMRLRTGIYVLSEDKTKLEPAFSWNGTQKNVFSGRYAEFMSLTAPRGARSVVVQAWTAKENDAFVFVPDCETASRAGTFRYFAESQRPKIKSMVAYCHVMSGLTPDEAFVITLDSNQSGLFSADVEAECRLLLPAFSRRIELELLVSFLTQKQETLPQPSLSHTP